MWFLEYLQDNSEKVEENLIQESQMLATILSTEDEIDDTMVHKAIGSSEKIRQDSLTEGVVFEFDTLKNCIGITTMLRV